MNFEDVTKDRIKLFDELLGELGKPPLFNNLNFELDLITANPRYLRFVTIDKETISLIISIEYDSVRLDVGGIPECFEWIKEEIDIDRNKIKQFFKELFTSYILLESCGSAYSKSRIYLFNKNGNLVNKYILRGFVHKFSGWNCDKQLFPPIY